MPAGSNSNAAQNADLIILVGDSESGLEAGVLREFAQQLRAECVNRPALYLAGSGTEVLLESR